MGLNLMITIVAAVKSLDANIVMSRNVLINVKNWNTITSCPIINMDTIHSAILFTPQQCLMIGKP